MTNGSKLRWGDLIVGVGLVAMLAAFSLIAKAASDGTAARIKCQSNLHQIGLAILLYQNENMQLFPRTTADTTGNPKPTWGTPYQADPKLGPVNDANPFASGTAKPAENDVTASLFLLLRNEQIMPEVFICPATGLKPFDFGGKGHTAQEWTNFPGNDGIAKHLSYSYQNPFGSNAAIASGFQMKNPDATFAVVADMSPGGPAVAALTMNSSADQMKAGNSHNHNGAGQNVLFGDGHAEWESTPFCGSMRDNIYTAGGPEVKGPDRKTAALNTSSVDSTDTILLPTAVDVGYKPPAPPKAVTAADAAKLRQAMVGTYTAKIGPRPATLVIDDKTIKATTGPLTVLWNYQITGVGEEGTVVSLTAPNSEATATITPTKDGVSISMESDFPLDFPWKRAK